MFQCGVGFSNDCINISANHLKKNGKKIGGFFLSICSVVIDEANSSRKKIEIKKT